MAMTALDGWRRYIETRDESILRAILHPDVVFESPVVFTPQRGRDITARYLAGAVAVLGGPGFRFVDEWRNARGAVLELETEIDGIVVNAVDIITVNDDGSLGGFNRSSQHSEIGGCDGHSKTSIRTVRTSTITISRTTVCCDAG